MSSFVLKMIGLISMLFDHSGYVIFGNFSFFNYIGRIAFPIFAFGISEGYSHTKDLKQYFLRLGIFALVSQLPYYLFFSQLTNEFSLNIFFTLFLGLLAITLYHKVQYKWVGFLIVIGIASLATIFPFEYSWYGIVLIFVFYLLKDYKLASNIAVILIMSVYSLWEYGKNDFGYRGILLWISMLSSLIFINLYNGKKGKESKYSLYLFYPLHLLVLFAILYFILY